MAIAGSLGVQADLPDTPPSEDPYRELWPIVQLYSESASRFIVEVIPEQREAFEHYMHRNGITDIQHIGTVTNTTDFVIRSQDELISLSLAQLQEAWKGGQA
jgi:phosphoribosylformylglycinamidine synthase